MRKQNRQNKILGGGEPRTTTSCIRGEPPRAKRRGGAKEFYFVYFVFSFFAYLLLFTNIIANAQFNLPSIGSIKPTISLTSDSLTPFPNTTITVTANLSGFVGAGNSNYVWFLNGLRQSTVSGLNKNTFVFKVGNISSVYSISVNVVTPSSESLSDSIDLTVSDVDLTWETNSKIPILYRAKAIPSQNSPVTISALPFIYRPGTRTLISSNNLIFNWKIDGKIDSSKSGLNKSLYTFRISNFPENSHLIRLEIKNNNDILLLSKEAIIPVAKPQVLLYFSDPATNLPYGPVLKNLTIKPSNLNFTAQTYFFATSKNLKWQWFINNNEVNSGTEKPWLATLNLTNEFLKTFSAQIKVVAQNPFNDLQIAQSIINLEVR